MTDTQSTEGNWESDILSLLNDLTNTQDELLDLLGRKREVMAKGGADEIQALAPDEEQLQSRLMQCHQRRNQLLNHAASAGMPSESLGELARALPSANGGEVEKKIEESTSKIRLLRHESLANWVMAQRAVLHLAEILEILATGGKQKPTYESGTSSVSRGNLVDQEA